MTIQELYNYMGKLIDNGYGNDEVYFEDANGYLISNLDCYEEDRDLILYRPLKEDLV